MKKRITTINFLSSFTLTLLVASFFIATNVSAITTGSAATSNTTTMSATEQQNLTKLVTRGNSEITRRLAQLSKLKAIIAGTTKLSSSDQATLATEVTAEISGLTALKVKLDAETTVSAVQADVQNIFSEYRVYALITPKVWLIKTADDQQIVEQKLSSLITKFQTRINALKSQGKEVTALQAILNDMQTRVTHAQQISSSIEQKVIGLQPSNYNTDHTILDGDAAQLKTAHGDNVAAYNDAKTIVSTLKTL